MARQTRIHFKGAHYHVILNGPDDHSLFRGVADRRFFETLVEEGCQRFDHRVHGYVWLKDRVQLIVEVDEVPLSRIMQNLSFRYTRHHNAAHDCCGSLFNGRYRAILFDPPRYLSELVRYLHHSPTRLGLARSAALWKWSSYGSYLGDAIKPWLTTSSVLQGFGTSPGSAQKAFRKFHEAGRQEGERRDLMRGHSGGRLLGDERFIRKALKKPQQRKRPMTPTQLVRLVCREEAVREAALASDSRARRESQVRQTIAYLALDTGVASLTAMATRFNRDLTTMSRNQRYFRDRLEEDAELGRRVRRLKRMVLAGA